VGLQPVIGLVTVCLKTLKKLWVETAAGHPQGGAEALRTLHLSYEMMIYTLIPYLTALTMPYFTITAPFVFSVCRFSSFF
jgi:hypothetical protein